MYVDYLKNINYAGRQGKAKLKNGMECDKREHASTKVYNIKELTRQCAKEQSKMGYVVVGCSSCGV